MATNKIKFEMTLKELTFKFEGDYEQGQRLQVGINKTLTDLGKLQGAAAGFEDAKEVKVIETSTVLPKSSRRRRRKSESPESAGENGIGATEQPTSENGNGGQGERRSSGVSPTQLLLGLRKTGYFSQSRTSGQVVTELNRQGHTSIKDSDLTSTFVRLCQRQVLSRDKDAEGKVWVYQAGSVDE